LRDERVSRNLARLKELGLDQFREEVTTSTSSSNNPKKKKKKRKSEAKPLAEPKRRSTRVIPSDATKTKSDELHVAASASFTPEPYSIPSYIRTELSHKAPSPATSSAPFFDPKRTHQHLTLSADKRTVATTGCAGYGVTLASSATSNSSTVSFKVNCLHCGTGGFGVGLSAKSWTKPPYKSVGKSKFSPGVYHSSGCLHVDGRVVERWGPSYGDGDVVSVTRTKDVVQFALNGANVGKSVRVAKGDTHDYSSLCVQPYMGGVARLL
jgi:hypothetical protein